MDNYLLGLFTGLMFILGYFIGRGSITKEAINETIKKYKPFKDSYVGGVNRPTSKQLQERNNPLLKGEMEAMRKSMKDMPV